MHALLIFLVLIVLIASYVYRHRAKSQIRKARELAARADHLADATLIKHLPTLIEKASPYIAYNDYGVLTIDPTFDGEIRYFVQRIILEDPGYVKAVQDLIKLDPTGQTRLLLSGPQISASAERTTAQHSGCVAEPFALMTDWRLGGPHPLASAILFGIMRALRPPA
jgi:hypothetical protein